MPSTVTWRSSMHSSRADCVLGEARLISSPSTMLANTAPGRNSKSRAVLVEDADAGDVAGQQVGRELDAAHRAVERAGQGLGEHRLADAGHVLDEQVALGEQHGERGAHDLGLALDHGLDRLADLGRGVDEVGDLRRRGRRGGARGQRVAPGASVVTQSPWPRCSVVLSVLRRAVDCHPGRGSAQGHP